MTQSFIHHVFIKYLEPTILLRSMLKLHRHTVRKIAGGFVGDLGWSTVSFSNYEGTPPEEVMCPKYSNRSKANYSMRRKQNVGGWSYAKYKVK